MCVTSIRIRFTTTRKTGSSPFSPPHASLPSYWVPGLFAWYGLHAYGPLSQCIRRKISLMWPTDDASISNGLRRKQGFLLVIAMMEMNERCWSRLGSSTFCATEDGKSSGWQGWYSMELPPRNLLRSWPSFTKTHSWSFISAFLYRHDHHSTSITKPYKQDIARQDTSLRLCKYFCAASSQLEIPFTRYRCILWSLFPVLNCLYMVPSRFCDRYLMQLDLSLPCDTSSFSLLSLEHIG